MAYEVKITKWHGGVLMDIEDREKVMLKFGADGCSRSEALSRAIHESVKDVKRLPKKVLDSIRQEIAFNQKKRMAWREAKKASKSNNASGRKSPRHVEVPES